MQLEKVTSQSGHAALAGWISSNDVTLFTTVLVMALAIFLAGKLNRGKQDNLRIGRENNQLAANLQTASASLEKSTAFLADLQKTLERTRNERDQLQQQLLQKLDAIANLNAKLGVLVNDKGQLESQYQSLLVTSRRLTSENDKLSTDHATTISERDTLKAKNSDLGQQLEALTSELNKKVAALEQIEADRERLNKQANELEATVAKLKQQAAKLNVDIAAIQASAAQGQAQSQVQIADLKSALATRDKAAEDYLAKLARATDDLQKLSTEKRELQKTLSDSESKHQAALLEEGRNNRELVGLTGNIKRVAVLFDASGSMRTKTADGSDRWAEAQAMAAKWLQHLNVEECTLIVFSSTVHTFPEDGSLADVRGANGKAKRDALLQQVRAVAPGGGTNTYEALRSAYQHDIDAILLFTDGAPSRSASGTFDPAAAKDIYELCRTHPKIPIHTVGLGNYFDQNASTFLMSLAKITGGTFRGE